MTETFTTTLGPARRVPRSRIWIEGARLVRAGFAVGDRYYVVTTDDAITLVPGVSSDPVYPTRTVSGKGTKPIIDLTGQWIRDQFPQSDAVDVVYDAGLITIVAHDTRTR
jgi:hypothetical protein